MRKIEPHAQVYAFDRGADIYFQRKRKGAEAIEVGGGGIEPYEEAAHETVSNVLTALFGPAGWYERVDGISGFVDRDDQRFNSVEREEAHEAAARFLDRCYCAWRHDSEDYEYGSDDEPARNYVFETVDEAVAQLAAANRAVTSVSNGDVWDQVREPILAEMLKLCSPPVRAVVAERYGVK